MSKIFYHKEFYQNWCSELVLLYPHLRNFHNIEDNRFKYLDDKKTPFEYVNSIEECDYVVLPYKWRGFDESTKKIINDVKLFNKKLLVFFNDDSFENIDITEDIGYIFRTSFWGKSRKNNEYALPPFFDDDFQNHFIKPEDIELSVGFCGVDHYERKRCLDIIRKNDKIKSDFIIRSGFWGGGVKKESAVSDFNKNMEKNLFGFSCRGAGNFSYRFYQTLSMGRIPILLNTDCVLPFDNFIDYNKHCLIVDVSNINDIDRAVVDYFYSKTKQELYEMEKNNRVLYENFLSPLGFLNNLNLLY